MILVGGGTEEGGFEGSYAYVFQDFDKACGDK